MIRFLNVVFVLILCSSVVAGAETVYTYYGKSSVTFAWEHEKDSNFDHYEVELRRIDSSGNVVEVFAYGTPNKQISVLRPRAGKYEVRVRAVNKVGNEFSFSDWCSSLDSACSKLKDGSQGSWLVRWKILAPLIIGVE